MPIVTNASNLPLLGIRMMKVEFRYFKTIPKILDSSNIPIGHAS